MGWITTKDSLKRRRVQLRMKSARGGVGGGSVVALVEYFESGCADGGGRVGAGVCEVARELRCRARKLRRLGWWFG